MLERDERSRRLRRRDGTTDGREITTAIVSKSRREKGRTKMERKLKGN